MILVTHSSSKRRTLPISSSRRTSLIQVVAMMLVGVLLLVIVELPSRVVSGQEQMLSIESRQQKDNDDLTDTIKYLEKLDKYFSQIARPRFGRSDYKQHRPQQQQPSWLRFSPDSPLTVAGQQQQFDPLDGARSRIFS